MPESYVPSSYLVAVFTFGKSSKSEETRNEDRPMTGKARARDTHPWQFEPGP